MEYKPTIGLERSVKTGLFCCFQLYFSLKFWYNVIIYSKNEQAKSENL